MLCKHYKDALIDAAASSVAPSGGLREHLAECTACRTAFAQEKSLFAGIDSGLQAAANSEVPSTLVPRVRARLCEVAAPRLGWVQPFVFASAAVALVLLVSLMVRPHRTPREDLAKRSAVAVAASMTPATDTIRGETSSESTLVAAIPANHPHTSRASTNRHSAASGNPEVLVPPGTELAFEQSLSSLHKDLKSLPQWHDQQIKPLEIEPLAIQEIGSAPLSPEEKGADRGEGWRQSAIE